MFLLLLSQNLNDMMGHFLELLHLGSQRNITILFLAPTYRLTSLTLPDP